jgi:hypothetical protein
MNPLHLRPRKEDKFENINLCIYNLDNRAIFQAKLMLHSILKQGSQLLLLLIQLLRQARSQH